MMVYVYVPAKDTFEPIPGMPGHLPTQIREALHTLHEIDTAGKEMLARGAVTKAAFQSSCGCQATRCHQVQSSILVLARLRLTHVQIVYPCCVYSCCLLHTACCQPSAIATRACP